jgi:hypothetical protein
MLQDQLLLQHCEFGLSELKRAASSFLCAFDCAFEHPQATLVAGTVFRGRFAALRVHASERSSESWR